ncbi:MAG: adenylate/guanylate cyclase domain-containing protein [Spirochaetes bacterium]|nr:adenylate/guanylate cyclase domain-containing protein [Spirochaetota bacterium]
MGSQKKTTLFKKFLFLFFKQNKLISEIDGDIREVYFGMRGRVLGLIVIVMTVTIFVLTLAIFHNNRSLIIDEKIAKARSLTKILAGPAEFYLDKDIETTKNDLNTKYSIIKTESQNFITYNDDISKIILTNEYGNVRYSTDKNDYKRSKTLTYIADGLKLEDGKLGFYDYSVENKNKNTGDKTVTNFRVITSPIFLHSGNAVEVLNDYNRLFEEYETASRARKDQIYAFIWKKYKDILGEEFDPVKNKQEEGISLKVNKAGDIDFAFLTLFADCMAFREKRVPKKERELWSLKWLYSQKEAKIKAYVDDSAANAKKINDGIKDRIKNVAESVERSRRLGVLAVVFNIDMINESSSRNVRWVLISALIALLLGSIAIFIILSFNVKNLKKLEKWSISVGSGNIDEKIHITTNDEIGRLGDLSNKMIEEIKLKYHLEKYVSKSTKSMLMRRRSTDKAVGLGVTERKDLAFIFSDVRGFTSFSENETPETVVETLNYYFEMQSNIIKSNKGDIDDYVGDQIMAHFSGEKKADRVIDTAIRIMRETARVNEERRKRGQSIFEVGIGVHGGEVVAGNIGSTFRMDFACIGDVVNLSSRLCSAAAPGEILASKHIFRETKRKFKKKDSPAITVKGKKDKIEIVKIEY